MNNLTGELASTLAWVGEEGVDGAQLVVAGGNGLVEFTATSPSTAERLPVEGYTSFVQSVGPNLAVGGTDYGCPGGVSLYEVLGSNGSLVSLSSYLPATWTTSGSCVDLVGMGSGGPYILLVQERSGNGRPIVGLLDGSSFTNVTSRFPPLVGLGGGPWHVTYGGGSFLLLTDGFGYLFSPTSGTAKNVTAVLGGSFFDPEFIGPSYEEIVWTGSAFLIGYAGGVESYNPTTGKAVSVYSPASGSVSLVTLADNETWVGVNNGGTTELLAGNTTASIAPVLGLWGTISDLVPFDGVLWAVGTDYTPWTATCQCFHSVLYSLVPSPVTVTFEESGLPAGTQWAVTVGGFAVSSTSSIVTAALGPGTYPFSVALVPGMVANPTSGVVAVSGGAPPTVRIQFSPRPGMNVYESSVAGWGSAESSLDPAVAYDTVDSEVIENVYEPLLAFAGNSTGEFVPVLATCVPGTYQCVQDYNETLVQNNSVTGAPQYFTFVLDPQARFYDAQTRSSWPVYPSDVMFSISRLLAFASGSMTYAYPGWILQQALLDPGDGGWDGGLHAPYNNTGPNILSSMLVNDSRYCPSAAMSRANGCITFDANGGGTAWPFLLELLAMPWVGDIEPCGWFTARGAGVPGFPGTHAAAGDGSCKLPAGQTSTSTVAFQNYLSSLSPTAWDSFEESAFGWPAPQPSVQQTMAGSGPYYLAGLSESAQGGYDLSANPAYAEPTGCGTSLRGRYTTDCYPGAGLYAPSINVHYETTDTRGIAGLAAGSAAFVGVTLDQTSSAEAATLTGLAAEGEARVNVIPSLTVLTFPFNMEWNLTTYESDGLGEVPTIPSDFFSGEAAREFMATAYPYALADRTAFTAGGIPLGVSTGGPIPASMTAYDLANVSFPFRLNGGVPDSNATDAGGAAWWWAQGRDRSSPYYDPGLAACSSLHPCRFPLPPNDGLGDLPLAIHEYISSVENLSGGAVQPFAENFSYGAPQTPPGQDPVPMYDLGWAADYPDPQDFMFPLVYPDTFFTAWDAVNETLTRPAFNAASCGHAEGTWQDLLYWAKVAELPQDCQGIAYSLAYHWSEAASSEPLGPKRALAYNEVEHVLNALGLYVWYLQSDIVEVTGPTIDPASVNRNPIIGGNGNQLWFMVQTVGSSNASRYPLTFTESGLPGGSSWSVTVGGSSLSTTGSALLFNEANGSYPFSVGSVVGFTANPATGTVSVSGNPLTVRLAFLSTEQSVTSPVGSSPSAVAYDAETGDLFVANLFSNNLTVVNALSGKVVDPSIPVGLAPDALLFDPSNGQLYVANAETNNLTVVDALSYAVTVPGVHVGVGPDALALDPATGELYVANYGSGNVTVVLSSSERVLVPGISVGTGPDGLAFDGANGTVLVSLSGVITNSSSEKVAAINATTNLLVDPVDGLGGSPTGIVYDRYTHELYALIPSENAVDVLSEPSLRVVATIPVAGNPSGISLGGQGRFVFVSSYFSGAITVINATSDRTVGAPQVVGAHPDWLASLGARGQVAVACQASDRVVRLNLGAAQETYSVSFSESGLPSGTVWYVNISGGSSLSGTASPLSVPLPNGTYTFSVAAADKRYSSAGGSFTVAGATVAETVRFSLTTRYAVVFTESGLSNGTEWFVNVSGQPSWSSSTPTLTGSLPNGSYTYTVGTVNKRWAAPAGGFTVSGGPVSVLVTFGKQTYTLTFTATFPSVKSQLKHVEAKGWTVWVNGTPMHSTSPTIVFSGLVNGTYPVLITGPSGYEVTGSGSVVVNGPSSESVAITKGRTVTLTFHETGLKHKPSWCVTLNGVQECTTKATLKFVDLTPGPYGYTVQMVTGYTVSPPSGSVTLTSSTTLRLAFTRSGG